MKKQTVSKKLLIEEVRRASKKMKASMKGLSIGALTKAIRKQLGMSQEVLAKRAKVTQTTISRVEKAEKDISVSTLQKILRELSCELLLVPLLLESLDSIRRKQARKVAEKHMKYLKGTMNLEQQQPDPRFIQELLKQEEERLLQGSSIQLWEE